MSDLNAGTTNLTNQGSLGYILGKGIIPQILLVLLLTTAIYILMMIFEIVYTSFKQVSGTRVDLLPFTVNSQDKPRQFEQNPRAKNSVHVPMSDNERSGAEFTYSFFLWINPASFRTEEGLLHIFHKGHPFYYPLMGPGVFLKSNTNALRVYMNSSKTWNNYIDVENIPVKKWVHVAIVARANTIEIYINGNLAKKLNMNGGVIYQNFGNIYLFSQRTSALQPDPVVASLKEPFMVYGPFNGNLSALSYFSYALSFTEIQSLVNKGFSTQTEPNVQDSPPYLQDSWWTTTYTS